MHGGFIEGSYATAVCGEFTDSFAGSFLSVLCAVPHFFSLGIFFVRKRYFVCATRGW